MEQALKWGEVVVDVRRVDDLGDESLDGGRENLGDGAIYLGG